MAFKLVTVNTDSPNLKTFSSNCRYFVKCAWGKKKVCQCCAMNLGMCWEQWIQQFDPSQWGIVGHVWRLK